MCAAEDNYSFIETISKKLKEDNPALFSLWSLISPAITYVEPDGDKKRSLVLAIEMAFTEDPIAEPLLKRIIRRNVNATKICVRKPADNDEVRFVSISTKLRANDTAELIAAPGSMFVCVISDDTDGLELALYDLRNIIYYER